MDLIIWAILDEIRFGKIVNNPPQPRRDEVMELLHLALMARKITMYIQDLDKDMEQITTRQFNEAITKYQQRSK